MITVSVLFSKIFNNSFPDYSKRDDYNEIVLIVLIVNTIRSVYSHG